MLKRAGAGSRAKIAKILRFWSSVFCTAGRSPCLGYCAQPRGACGGLHVQRPASSAQHPMLHAGPHCAAVSSATRVPPPCLRRARAARRRARFPRARARGASSAGCRLHPHRQPRRVDTRLPRQQGHPHAEHRSARRRGNPLHARAELQSRVLTNARDEKVAWENVIFYEMMHTRAIRTNASTSSASPHMRTHSAHSPTNLTNFSSAKPIQNTTCGIASARKLAR